MQLDKLTTAQLRTEQANLQRTAGIMHQIQYGNGHRAGDRADAKRITRDIRRDLRAIAGELAKRDQANTNGTQN